MNNKHFFNLNTLKPKMSGTGGSRTYVGKNEVSALNGISFELLKLNKDQALEPIWHPNANTIGYCLQGDLIVSILTPSTHETFTIQEGDVFFIPKGALHYLANEGDNEGQVAFAFSHDTLEELNLPQAVYSLSDFAFDATFGKAPHLLEDIQKSKQDSLFIQNGVNKKMPMISSRFKFNIDESNRYLTTKGGYLQAATKPNLPIIEGLGVFTFGLNPKGIVEPHWHTNAGELIYVIKGHVRVSVLSPDGSHDVQEIQAGEGGFAPESYFHSIENLENEDAKIVAFFNHADPNYIGIGQAVGLFSNEVLTSIFHLSPDRLKQFTPPTAALVIAGG